MMDLANLFAALIVLGVGGIITMLIAIHSRLAAIDVHLQNGEKRFAAIEARQEVHEKRVNEHSRQLIQMKG